MATKTERIIAVALSCLFLGAGGIWLGQVSAQEVEPGSSGDPLVSKSYVDLVLSSARAQLEQTIAGVRSYADATFVNRQQLAQATASIVTKADIEERSTYRIVTVPAGQVIIGAASTEVVLRGGQATAVTTAAGGLLDVTGGWDIPHGEPIPPNHLLVVPRDDGRGLHATTDLILLVKGAATIQAPAAAQD